MQINVIILLSVIGYSLGERLQVKCGDELCEKPSNRAVTTLRYTPDKPYKLQINSVNSEVDIFGATDDLFYIRYGRNFGFLPKNHLREKARGNFMHSVEIDIATLHINQEVRETNYLHEFIKLSSLPPSPSSSHSHAEPNKNINDNSNETKENVKLSEEEVKAAAGSENSEQQQQAEVKEEERATDYIPIGTEPKIEAASIKLEEEKTPEVVTTNTEEENDSGVEEDDEGEEDENDEGDDEEEAEDEKAEFMDTPEQNINITSTETINDQPELIAIPPSKHVEEEVPVETTSTPPHVDNSTLPLEESPKIEPELPETVTEIPPIVEAPVENIDKPAEASATNETQSIDKQEVTVTDDIQQFKEEIVNEIFKPQEEEEKKDISDPAPVTEEIIEDHHHHDHHHENEATKVVENIIEHEAITEMPTETSQNDTETSKEEEIKIDATEVIEPQEFTKLPEIDIPEIVQMPEEIIQETSPIPEIIKEKAPEIKQEVIEEIPQIKEKHEHKLEQDMLMKRFKEKLGGRGSNEGIGSVKQLHREDHHHHHHSHESHSHSHSHSHDNHIHEHIDEKSQQDEPAVIETIKLEGEEKQDEESKPGFLSGLMKKIFGDKSEAGQQKTDQEAASNSVHDEGFCEKIDSEDCPKSLSKVKREVNHEKIDTKWVSTDEYFKIAMHEAIERMDLIISMALVALTVLIFTFGYYCISKARKEGPLIAKMNELERHLMASGKENEQLKGEIVVTKQKLVSIEDNSFGSNDMVIALKNDLEMSENEKYEMQEKISSLEKELEAAAEDGLELNRMVSELLSNQTGSDSIISSVEDLQRQLNEQQETIVTMNETLATKSRENSELQIQLAEMNGKCNGELEKSQQTLDALALERNNLQIELENLKRESDMQVNQIIEERNGEVTRLNNELTSYASKYDETKKRLNTAEAKVQALDECIETFKKNKGGGGDIKALLDVADLKADLLAVTKEKSTIQEQLQTERDSRKLLEDRVKSVSEEMSNLKKEFVTADKEKLEAQTRLEVLSTYFKEKETQLQQELSVKEARWMKQQGEKTSTVEKIQALNDEIQTLKSQNDSLRAEIEAQAAAHKLNISTTEAQAHTAWLNARQAERKLEESRMEAAALRRRLTSIAENPSGASDILNGLPGATNDSMNSIPSPIRVESPNNVNQMPPMMMPPPFLPGAPPFLPPFLPPPGDLPPMGMGMMPPLGRLMSPPPKRFTPTMRDDRDRYSPRDSRRYSPDSRYDDDYTAFETETDYSPPRTPTPPRRGYSSPTDHRNNKKSKGGHSSGDSNKPSRRK